MDAGAARSMWLRFEADIIHWRGPSPFFFVAAPEPVAAEIRAIARGISYGWGMAPVVAKVGGVVFTTSLFPKDGTYLLPLKAAVRRQAGITAGDRICVALTVEANRP